MVSTDTGLLATITLTKNQAESVVLGILGYEVVERGIVSNMLAKISYQNSTQYQYLCH